MSNTVEEKKKLHAARKNELAEAVGALQGLEAERTKAAASFAADLSQSNKQRVAKLDADVADARLTVEALTERERVASEELAAAVLEAKRQELAKLEKDADADALRKELYARLVAHVVAAERDLYAKFEAARARCRSQREIVERCGELAAELGTATVARPLHIDELRVLGGVAVGRAREEASREDVPIEALFSPIYRPAPETCDEAEYANAVEFLKTAIKEKKSR